MSLPFTPHELREIKLAAWEKRDQLVMSLFEHIENPERIAELEAEVEELQQEVADYRDQNTELESRIKKSLIV